MVWSMPYLVWKMFFFVKRRRGHTRWNCDWSSDVCSSDLGVKSSGVKQHISKRLKNSRPRRTSPTTTGTSRERKRIRVSATLIADDGNQATAVFLARATAFAKPAGVLAVVLGEGLLNPVAVIADHRELGGAVRFPRVNDDALAHDLEALVVSKVSPGNADLVFGELPGLNGNRPRVQGLASRKRDRVRHLQFADGVDGTLDELNGLGLGLGLHAHHDVAEDAEQDAEDGQGNHGRDEQLEDIEGLTGLTQETHGFHANR